jgi:hypothetical protein
MTTQNTDIKTQTWVTINRVEQGWPSGEWDGEPDEVQWGDEATGLACLLVRHPYYGHWCGYVGVPPGHPLYGEDYNDIAVPITVHGGLTFSNTFLIAGNPAEDIYRMQLENDKLAHSRWWFGFDCVHLYDLSPYDLVRAKHGYPFTLSVDQYDKYRNLPYVKNQCGELAKQLAAIA